MNKKIQQIILLAIIPLSYFPAHYACTTNLIGMQVWGGFLAGIMLFAGVVGTLVLAVDY